MKRKVLAWILAAAMTVSMIPVTAFGEEIAEESFFDGAEAAEEETPEIFTDEDSEEETQAEAETTEESPDAKILTEENSTEETLTEEIPAEELSAENSDIIEEETDGAAEEISAEQISQDAVTETSELTEETESAQDEEPAAAEELPTEEILNSEEETAEPNLYNAELTSGYLKYTVSDEKVTITGYTGSPVSLTIPSYLDGYPVTAIGNNAFSGCSTLTSITLPETVTSLGYAFLWETSVTTVTVPKSVTSAGIYYVNNIHKGAFSGCDTLTSVIFEEGITTIPGYICYGVTGLKTVSIPGSVSVIESYAFEGCSSLWAALMDDNSCESVTIGSCVFKNCEKLNAVELTDNVTSMGDGVFQYCSSLRSLTLPANLESIGCNVLYGTAVTSITVPKTLKTCGRYYYDHYNRYYYGGAFNGCTTLTSVTFEEGMTAIPNYMCEFREADGVSGLTQVQLPDTLTTIGENSFAGAKSLTGIELPDSLQEIGAAAFEQDTALAEINIPGSVTSIGDGAFLGDTSLVSVQMTQSTDTTVQTTIGTNAFKECTSLCSVTLSNQVTSISDAAFYGCSSLTSLSLPDSVTYLGHHLIQGTSITEITVPKNLTSVGNSYIQFRDGKSFRGSVFSGCETLKKVIFAEGLEKIPEYICFWYGGDGECNIQEIEISDTVTEIGYRAFKGCTSLTSIHIPKSVTVLGAEAFEDNTALTGVEIPDGALTIGTSIFEGCTALTLVKFYETNSTQTLPGATVTGVAEVEDDDEETHQLKIDWKLKDRASITVPAAAFRDCTALEAVYFPSNLGTVDQSAFSNCTALSRVYFEGSETAWENVTVAETGNDTLLAAEMEYNENAAKLLTGTTVQISPYDTFVDVQTERVEYDEEDPDASLTLSVKAEKKVKDYYIRVCAYRDGVNSAGENVRYLGTWSDTYKLTVYNYVTAGDVKKSVEAFCESLNAYLKDLNTAAKADQKNVEEVSVSWGKILMQSDESSKNERLVTFKSDVKLTERQKLNIYETVASYIDSREELELDEIKVKSDTQLVTTATKIINDILSNVKDNAVVYRKSSSSGEICIKTIGGVSSSFAAYIMLNSSVVATLTAGTDGAKETMVNYLENLSEITEDLLYQSLESVFAEMAKVSGITDFVSAGTQEWLKSIDSAAEANLKSAGYGSLKKILAGGKTAYDTIEKIKDAATTTDLKTVLEDADSIYKTIDGLSFSDDAVDKVLLDAATKELENQRSDLAEVLKAYINKTEKGEPTSVAGKVLRKLNICCPVDFTITGTDGVVAQVENGKVTYAPELVAQVNGSTKTVYLDGEKTYTITYTGTGTGTMDVTVQDTVEREVSGQIDYYDIPLTDGVTYKQTLTAGALTETSVGDPITGSESTISGSLHQSVTELAVYKSLTVTAGAGGSIVGETPALTAAATESRTVSVEKGELAYLKAVPDEGYCFAGWYETAEDDGESTETLVGTDEDYYFAVTKDCSLTARFEKEVEEYGTVIGADYEENASVYVNQETDASASEASDEIILYLKEDTGADLSVTLKIWTESSGEAQTSKAVMTRTAAQRYVLYGQQISSWVKAQILDTDGKVIVTIVPKAQVSEAICERDGHTYVVVEEQAATCTVSGYQVLSCSVCGDEKTEEISAEHNYVSAETKKATCAETGYELFRCTVCGAETKTVLAKTTNHSWKTITVQPDCETAGSSVECCTVCGAKQNAKTLSASGHQYKTTVKAASPGEDGAITEKCTVCGKTGTTTVIAAPKTLELSKTSYTYDKKAKLPKVTVKDANGAVISTSNYTVSYASGRKNVGTYAVTVTLTGNYSGTLTSSFKIVPKGTSIEKLKAAKKSLTVTIEKQKTQTSGYEIQYSTSKNFKKSKTKTVKKNTVTKVTLKKLKKGTRYYVRIRTYKIIKGKKYYSKWSKAKKIRTKK